jgi:hypothetical protein
MLPIGDDNSARRTAPLVTYALMPERAGILSRTGWWRGIHSVGLRLKRFSPIPPDFPTRSLPCSCTGWLPPQQHAGSGYRRQLEDRFGHVKPSSSIYSAALRQLLRLVFNAGSGISNTGASGRSPSARAYGCCSRETNPGAAWQPGRRSFGADCRVAGSSCNCSAVSLPFRRRPTLAAWRSWLIGGFVAGVC